MPKVSVIMPVYNVEKYVADSIESVLCQTFIDFELIIVESASTDNSGEICDKYAKSDNRITVIHEKERGGLSKGRNVGIDWVFNNSNSEFFLFVDSDDHIDQNLLSKVIAIQAQTNSDIVMFGYRMTDDNLNPLSWGETLEKEVETFSSNNKLIPLLPPYDFGDYAWNKFCKKELFSEIRFPNGKAFEDTYTSYKLFDLANCVTLIPDHLYLYRRNSNSLTFTGGVKSRSTYFDAVKQKYLFISNNYKNLCNNAAAGLVNSVAAILFQIPTKNISNEYKHLLSDIRLFLIENKNIIDYNTLSSTDNIDICKELIHSITKYKNYRKRKSIKRKIIGIINSLPEKAMLLKQSILKTRK